MKKYTITDVAEEVGIPNATVWMWVHYRAMLPSPTAKKGYTRKYYSEAEYQEVVKQARELKGNK